MSTEAPSTRRDQPPQRLRMRLLVTGGTGVLGRALRPLAEAAGHELTTPTREELDLFDPVAVAHATRNVDGILHLATRIPSLERRAIPDAWRETIGSARRPQRSSSTRQSRQARRSTSSPP
jgi:uncharacterized protein YbjT (DUF2867 family)